MVNCGKIFLDLKLIQNNQSTLNSLIGTYECKADAKGRLMLPVALKKQLSPVMQNGFVLKRSVFQTCLELYPMSEWESLMQKINNSI